MDHFQVTEGLGDHCHISSNRFRITVTDPNSFWMKKLVVQGLD